MRSLMPVAGLLALSGCIATSGLSGTEPAAYCTDEACAPGTTEFKQPWGPFNLSGGISLGNLVAIASWASEVETAIDEADQVVRDKTDAYACGPSCKKDWQITRTVELTVNGDAPGPACSGASFTTDLSVKGEGVTCWAATASMISGVNSSAADLDAQCAALAPGCTAGLIKVDFDKGFELTETPSAFWCVVEGTASVTVQCSGDAAGISSPSASGLVKANVACAPDNQCPANHGEQKDQVEQGSRRDEGRDDSNPQPIRQ